jgi:hypothetical protein
LWFLFYLLVFSLVSSKLFTTLKTTKGNKNYEGK